MLASLVLSQTLSFIGLIFFTCGFLAALASGKLTKPTNMRGQFIIRVLYLLVTSVTLDICLATIAFEKATLKPQSSSIIHPSEQKSRQSLQDPHQSVRETDQDLQRMKIVGVLQERPNSPAGQFCFEEKCQCSVTVADCSHNYGRLTYIPRLSPLIKSLVFSFNNLTIIPTDNFFHNVSSITSLDLSNNGLQHISSRAFVPMRSLRSVYLDHNRLAPCQLKWAFSSRHLLNVSLAYNNLVSFPEEVFFQRQSFYELQWLNLTGNSVKHLNMSVFRHAPNLAHLRASHNRLVRVTSHFMQNLRTLQLDNNALFELPQSCSENGTSLFPRLFTLTFSDNKFSAFSDGKAMCFTVLAILDMSRNPIKFLVKDMFGNQRFPQLRSLSLNANRHIERIGQFAFRSTSLQRLFLERVNVAFNVLDVSVGCFAGNQHLLLLQLDHNFLRMPESKFKRLLDPLQNLRRLYLGHGSIERITASTFSALRNLSILSLHENRISELPDKAFDSLTSLKSLILSRNQLQTVSKSAFSVATRTQLEYLDMSGNPFACDCDLLWFQHWLVSSPSVFSNSYEGYVCSDLANTSVEAFSLTQQQCLWSRETYRTIIACVVVFIAVVIMVSVVYHYRWHIRLMLAFRGRSEVLRRRLEAENFDYDVFVSFAGEDLAWVQQHLMAKLETELGLRLCIHERDFVPGKNILNNIVDSVQGSKKFLMVFSRHFTHSPWCQFELDLCLGHTLDYGDALIVTCLGDVATRDLTSTMAAVLETTTYIRWRDNRDAVTSFWDKVTLSLRDIMPGDHENSV